MPNSICIVTISKSLSKELIETIKSIIVFSQNIQKTDNDVRFGHVVVNSEELTKKETIDIYNIYKSSKIYIKVFSGIDKSLYDAMNIGVNYAYSENYSQLLFVNSGSTLITDINVKRFMKKVFRYENYIKLFGGKEYVIKSNREISVRSPNISKWVKRPYSMPTLHQSIVYPINLLKKYPYIAYKGMLASDYIHLIYMVKIKVKFITSNQLLTKYINNGVSSQNPYKSIIQRFFGLYMVNGNIFEVLILTIVNILKTFLAKLIGIR